ncbi:MAG: UDP-N-acetylmuramoyl-tripeptide--D-alanyl-D-alanine ligase [Lachnospiraceae bacterium]|nr:UDP-N-acetylmuramoyl-tripeptide--D-alanyl-D-alanine ligase [Lachnospiraceae bacterium]
MLKNMNLTNVAAACHGELHNCSNPEGVYINGAVIDSRQVEDGFLFVAVKGERVDGHDFVKDLLNGPAACALVEVAPEDCDKPYIVVPSTLIALKEIAAFYRQQLNLKVVGITGSVGKTSTKEMIASVLAQKYNVLKTEGNFNNEIGLPLTIMRIRDEHEVAVLEMGISDFDEMHRLAAIGNPDISVITNIGTCHLENLGDRDGVLRAKTEMFDHLTERGLAILNGEDDKLATVLSVNGKAPVFFGIHPEDATVPLVGYATNVKNLGLDGMQATIHYEDSAFDVHIHVPGIHNVANAVAATCVAKEWGLTDAEIQAGVNAAGTITGRSNLIHADNGLTIIDDCYNANPMSMKEALNILDTASGRKIAVLGDMGELGVNERSLHREVGEHMADLHIDELYAAGELSAEIVAGARSVAPQTTIHAFATRDELLAALTEDVKPGDTVLVKASHFMSFTKIVNDLKALQF